MKYITIFRYLLLALLFWSCGSSSSESIPISETFDSQKTLRLSNQLQHIVTKEMVAKVANVPTENIKAYQEKSLGKSGQFTVLYSWPTGKMKKIEEADVEIGEYHSFSIGFVQAMNEERFANYYGTNQGLQEQVDNLVKRDDYNQEIGKMEADNIAAYAQLRKTERLENVGTLAFWETPMQALHVLAKDVAFTITANFGSNEKLAKEKALQLTKEIVNP